MNANEVVKKYLGKRVALKQGGTGIVYAILIRPEQYGPLFKVAFDPIDADHPLTLDEAYQNRHDNERTCSLDWIHSIID